MLQQLPGRARGPVHRIRTPGDRRPGHASVGVQVWGVGRFPTSADGCMRCRRRCTRRGTSPGRQTRHEGLDSMNLDMSSHSQSMHGLSQNLVPAYFEENN
jgi:hypothetical protein